jgi:Predicted metal-dependent hydrolase of the TIM-barrel fold
VAAYDNDHFRYTDLEKLIQDNQLVGIKFYTGYQHYYPFDLYDPNADRPVSAHYHNPLQICSELQIPAIFHCGDCLCSYKQSKLKYAHPLNIDEPATDYDDVNFIIAHMGYPWHRDAAQVCYKNSNVYADVSGFVYGNFQSGDKNKFKQTLLEFLDIAEPNKLLFGSDWPISNQDSYLEALDWISTSITNRKVSEALTAQVMSKNVKKVFNLK